MTTNNDEPMPDHFRLAPSSASRWLKCPGSAGAPSDDSEASILGTTAHAMIEQLLAGSEMPTELENYFKALPADVQDKTWGNVLGFVDFIRNLPEPLIHSEIRIRHAFIEEHGGTIDALCFDAVNEVLHIADYKNGAYEVFAADNKQMKSYMNLARQLFPQARRFFATIYQPNVKHGPETVEYTLEELEQHQLEVFEASTRDEFIAGPHCRWCPLLINCSVAHQAAIDAAQIEFGDLPLDPVEDRIDKLEHIVQMAKVMEKLEKAAKAELIKIAQQGVKLHEFKVAYHFSNWKWCDDDSAKEAVREIVCGDEDLPPEVMLEMTVPAKMKSPAQVKDILRKHGVKWEPTKTDLVERKLTSYQLRPKGAKDQEVDFAEGFIDLTVGDE